MRRRPRRQAEAKTLLKGLDSPLGSPSAGARFYVAERQPHQRYDGIGAAGQPA